MLRKRPVTGSSKQGLMADLPPLSSLHNKYSKPSLSFFISPRLFTAFSPKPLSDSEAAMSPTSILDNKPFSTLSGTVSPFWFDRNAKSPELCVETRRPWKEIDSRGVGLGIVDALNNAEDSDRSSKSNRRMVLLGSQLKIQIPHLPSFSISPSPSPDSPSDYGIKSFKSISVPSGASYSGPKLLPPTVFTGCLSASEMELSEDYTCVVAHGPNPKTTHIFDNGILHSCRGGFVAARKEDGGFSSNQCCYPSDGFLSFCFACKKKLGQGKDIYMYRGEKAFCNQECRYKEMISDEMMEQGPVNSSLELYDE